VAKRKLNFVKLRSCVVPNPVEESGWMFSMPLQSGALYIKVDNAGNKKSKTFALLLVYVSIA
jgi:hypothetical protein